jgi:hypothetical protein
VRLVVQVARLRLDGGHRVRQNSATLASNDWPRSQRICSHSPAG